MRVLEVREAVRRRLMGVVPEMCSPVGRGWPAVGSIGNILDDARGLRQRDRMVMSAVGFL